MRSFITVNLKVWPEKKIRRTFYCSADFFRGIPQLFSLEVVVSVVVTPFSVVVVVVVVSPFTVVETVEVEELDVVHAARAKIITHTSRSTNSFFMINSSFQ